MNQLPYFFAATVLLGMAFSTHATQTITTVQPIAGNTLQRCERPLPVNAIPLSNASDSSVTTTFSLQPGESISFYRELPLNRGGNLFIYGLRGSGTPSIEYQTTSGVSVCVGSNRLSPLPATNLSTGWTEDEPAWTSPGNLYVTFRNTGGSSPVQIRDAQFGIDTELQF